MGSNTNIVPATTQSANVEVATENVAASQARVGDREVAAAMADFACDQIRRRAGRALLGRTDATPRTTLRLLG
jgi:flagellin-like hook-associated protein FlgL